MRRLSICIALLVGCGGADFDVGATGGDTGESDAAETSGDAPGPDALADTGTTPPDTRTGTETSQPPDTKPPIDTGGSADTGSLVETGPPDIGPEVCPDKDGDGETDAACGGTDCNDSNKDVFSKQTAWFPVAYTTTSGAKSFDYNCSGKEEIRWPARLATCKPSGADCVVDLDGWADVPTTCGSGGYWIDTCHKDTTSGACTPWDKSWRKNDCH